MSRRSRPPLLRAPVAPGDLVHATYAHAPLAVRRRLREAVRAGAENRPGVYRMLGATGLVLYVGKSARVRTRLLSYFQAARKRQRRDRQARILRMAHDIEWEYCHDEFAALLRELRLIKQHRPRFNVAMNVDEIPRGWIGLTGGAVPGLRVVLRSDDPEASVLYGPFRRLSMLQEAVRALAEATGIRDCDLSAKGLAYADGAPRRRGRARATIGATAAGSTMAGATTAEPATVDASGTARARDLRSQGAPPPTSNMAPAVAAGGTDRTPLEPSERSAPRSPGCLRHELGGCLGPCIAAPTAATYAERVAEARAFLAGRTRRPIDTLHAAMIAAAEAWHFERAGSLKAKVEALGWLAGRLARFHAGADRLSFAYRVPGHDGTERVYLIRRGTVRAERAAPTCAGEEAELERVAARVYDGPDPAGADIPTHDLEEFYLVASWFRTHPPDAGRITYHSTER